MKRENFYQFDTPKFRDTDDKTMQNDLCFLAVIYGILPLSMLFDFCFIRLLLYVTERLDECDALYYSGGYKLFFNSVTYGYFLKKPGGYWYLFLNAILKVLQFL
jgi:hypothetical protein